MQRRTVLKWAGVAASMAGCGGGGGGGVTPPAGSGNVLMIAIDDLNDWVGFLGGHPQVRTPGMDALAARSTVFDRAFCTAPLCSPARAGLLSGLSVASTGVYKNEHNFRSVNPGKAEVDDMFHAAGYTVARYGKVDHVYTPVDTPVPSPLPYSNKVCPAPVGEGGFDWGPAAGADEDQPDYHYAQSGIDFLNGQPEGQPFFLSVGFVRTHVGWFVPQRFFDMYPRDQVVLPIAPADDLDDLGPEGRATALMFNAQACITGQGLWVDAVRAYLAAISWVDSQIARLLAALDASPHAANTTVVLWSDHGFHLGEKFHWHKMALWEHTTRVPFLIRRPGQTAGAVVASPVSMRDLTPTLLDLHKVAPAYAMDGVSLAPLLANPQASWDRPVLTTRNQNDHAIRTADWRYIRYASGEKELYDRRGDANEFHNLAGNAAYASVIAQLDALMPAAV